MQKQFIWNYKPPKIKHSTLIAPYSKGGLNNVDIELSTAPTALDGEAVLNKFEQIKVIPKI